MIAERLKEVIAQAASVKGEDVFLEHPADVSHGDYSSNVAMVLARKRGVNPRDLAKEIVRYIEQRKPKEVDKVEVAGPGFVNIFLSHEFFAGRIAEVLQQKDTWGSNDLLREKRVMVEYTDPNPFKEMHAGHLMTNVIGESISRLFSFSGAEVKRANYQGDVGVHVAKAVWGLKQLGVAAGTITPENLGRAYAAGAKAYERGGETKGEIDAVNKKIYEGSKEPDINKLYKEGRCVSLEHFEGIYRKLGTSFDYYFYESETGALGKQIVHEHMDVFKKSDGAVVFRGERHDPSLHTRVFITSQGLPTYEAKELGLARIKFNTWEHDLSVVITAHEIEAYYRVVMKALEHIEPELSHKIRHVSHGFLRLPTGKMSSRTGVVITAASLIEEVKHAALEKVKGSDLADKESVAEQVAVAAIKYSILKQAAVRDIIFDMQKALSFEGDSGPYLQYAHTRARSVLEKARKEGVAASTARAPDEVIEIERLLYRFPESVERALDEYEPHYVATFLTEIAGAFNRWYAKETIVDASPEAPYKVALAEAFAITMKNGLWLLGIRSPGRM